jgi:serine O-acetyltransferase
MDAARIMDDQSYVLQALFDFLEHHAVSYCVMGDTRRYPEHLAGDIEIVVSHDAFTETPRLLAWFCRNFDLRLVQMTRQGQGARRFVLVWLGESGRPRALALGVRGELRCAGRQMLDADRILELRERPVDDEGNEKGFYVAAPHIQFIYSTLSRIDSLDLAPQDGEYLSWSWRRDPFRAQRELERFWRRAGDVALIGQAAENSDWSGVQGELRRLRRSLRRAAPLAWTGGLADARRRLGSALTPSGLAVAFLGPNGAGKSSVIERVLADLAPVFRHTGYLPLRLHSRRGPYLSALDCAATYALRIWPERVRSGLVVVDRYLHDMLADPQRFRYGDHPAAARWAAKLVPAPDLSIVLDAPAEVLQQGESEVSGEDSEHQRIAYIRLAGRLSRAVVVDARGDSASVAAEAEGEILRHLEQRLEDRCAELRLLDNPRAARLLLFLSRHRIPVLSALCRAVFNSDIDCAIRFPVHLPHPYGIVMHSGTVLGRHVTVMQQVTLGSKALGQDVAPVIDDDVFVGAGAKVLGAVRIGRGAIIGANAVVTRDVPPYCTVVGVNHIAQARVADPERAQEAALDPVMSGLSNNENTYASNR